MYNIHHPIFFLFCAHRHYTNNRTIQNDTNDWLPNRRTKQSCQKNILREVWCDMRKEHIFGGFFDWDWNWNSFKSRLAFDASSGSRLQTNGLVAFYRSCLAISTVHIFTDNALLHTHNESFITDETLEI